MKKRQQNTLSSILTRPPATDLAWEDVEALLTGLGAKRSEPEVGRVAFVLSGEVRVFHRHTALAAVDGGAVAGLRTWLTPYGVGS